MTLRIMNLHPPQIKATKPRGSGSILSVNIIAFLFYNQDMDIENCVVYCIGCESSYRHMSVFDNSVLRVSLLMARVKEGGILLDIISYRLRCFVYVAKQGYFPS